MKKLIMANTGGGRRRPLDVFRDFCELGALAVRNSIDHVGADAREQRYLEVAAGYSREEMDRFAEMLAWLTLELGDGLNDVLGHEYMHLGFGNDRMGQFFTPYSVSRLSAKMTVAGLVDRVADHEFITAAEPAAGSGGMIIALAECLRDEGVNYQRQLHVTAMDLDATAVHMTYLQLALLHIPAVVTHGNTLTMVIHDAWPTPAHVVGGWAERLSTRTEGAKHIPALSL